MPSDAALDDRPKPSGEATAGDRWPVVALILLFLAAVIVSWQRWTHPIVDHGREMNVPARLVSGDRLYIDIFYYYGPLAPSFIAALFRLFGIHLWVLHGLGLLCAALSLAMLYRLARHLLAPWDAAMAVALVLVTCAFAGNIGNYVQPYAYAALFAWVFALGSLAATCAYAVSGRDRWLVVAGLCVGAAAGNKIEFAVIAGVPAALTLALKSWIGNQWPWRPAGLLVMPCLAAIILAWLPVVLDVDWRLLVSDAAPLVTQPQLVYFARHLSGTLAWPATGFAIVAGLGMLLSAGGVAALVGTLAGGRPGARLRSTGPAWCCAVAGAACWGAVAWVPGYMDVTPVRATPLVLATLGIGGVVALHRRRLVPATVRASLHVVALSAFGLLAATRVVLNASLQTPYTIFTAPLAILVCCYLLVQLGPRVLVVDPAARRRAANIGRIMLAGVLVWQGQHQAELVRERNDTPIRSRRGTLFANGAYALPFSDAIQYVTNRTQPNEPIVCLPQCTLIHFFAERPNPLREESVVPGFLTPEREEEVIRRIADRGVRTILVANVVTREYRDATFGRDYNVRLMSWILANYREDETFASSPRSNLAFGDRTFFIRAYVRRDASSGTADASSRLGR